MNKRNIFVSLLLMAGMTACINDADVMNVNPGDDPEAGTALSVSIIVPNSSPSTKTVEDSEVYEKGNANEYQVKKVDLYLFNSETDIFYNVFALKNLSEVNDGNANQTVKYKGSVAVNPGQYKVLAIANSSKTYSPVTLKELLNKIDNSTYTNGLVDTESIKSTGIVMTNRGIETVGQSVEVKSGQNTSLTITLERVLAKLKISKAEQEWKLQHDGETYVTITPGAFGYVNLNTEFYLFRHVATLPGMSFPAKIEDWSPVSDHFGTIKDEDGYAIDPYFFEKKPGATDSFNRFAYPLSDGFVQGGLILKGNPSIVYCLGNANFRTAQLQGYTTGVIIQCGMDIAEGHYFDFNGDNKVVSVPSKDVEDVYYFNHNFYASIAVINAHNSLSIPTDISEEELAQKYYVKHFRRTKGGGSIVCYYTYWIKHQDEPDGLGVMEYAVVRNNIYDIIIKNIADLGSGEPGTDPEVPVEKKGFIDVDVEVMPWFVRDNDASLED